VRYILRVAVVAVVVEYLLVPQLAGTRRAAAQARLQPLVGTVTSTFAYEAERAYVLAFFDQTLRGGAKVTARVRSIPGVRAAG